MKYIPFLLLFYFNLTTVVICQVDLKSGKSLVAEIEGEYELDENENVTYTKIVEIPGHSVSQILSDAKDYFLGFCDKDTSDYRMEGNTFIGESILRKIATINSISGSTVIDTWYILKIDAKEGKARIKVTLTRYLEHIYFIEDEVYEYYIKDRYPFRKDDTQKNIHGKAFYFSHKKALETIAQIEETLSKQKNSDDEW